MSNWELTQQEFENLDDKKKEIYIDAKMCMNSEDAGGLFGWVRGMELLKSMGWTEQRRKEGHRVFVSLCKPPPPQSKPHRHDHIEQATQGE